MRKNLCCCAIYAKLGSTDLQPRKSSDTFFFSWWIERFMHGPKHFEDLKS